MCKKRKIITITVLFVLGVVVSYLQWGREIDVAGNMGTSSENFHEEHVTFTLNRLIITDKEKCAEEIIKKCRENDFASTLFSYDVAKPKIQSEAFILVIAILALSIFIKAYMLDMGVREYLTEMIVMIVSIVYLSIRGAMVGYSSMDNLYFGKKFKVISTLLLAVLITIFNGIRNYTMYGEKYTGILDVHFLAVIGITFISSLIFVTLILGAVYSIEKIGQKRLEKQFDNDEE